ncbi:hypothetical protein CDCA_CDCA03G1075 [Cyanidium caldarium]|uniref:Uncharacterized protein n=1 Tax=Cyanidium caldarium TaxID=2771 RepID=A0AAV9ISH0_CYACA|nr:hypothetical protein CDCA_CDCA03G1075 [Cyanidium caldarium]
MSAEGTSSADAALGIPSNSDAARGPDAPHAAAVTRQVNELEAERAELELVLDTLRQLEEDMVWAASDNGEEARRPRRCWQQVGDVLVERRLDELRDSLQDQRERLVAVVQQLSRQLQQRTSDS